MTQYASVNDFLSRFGENEAAQIADLENEGNLNNKTLATALEDASNLIDSYLTSRYTIPLPSNVVIKPLALAACNIARYYLYKDRPTDEVTKRFEDVVKWLKDVSANRASLIFDPSLNEAEKEASNAPVVFSGNAPGSVFSDSEFAKMPNTQWPF